MDALEIMANIWKKEKDIQTYAMKLYDKAGGKFKRSIHDSYVATDIKLFRQCQQRAEIKLNKEKI